MIPFPSIDGDAYRNGLRAFLEGETEAGLERAYEIGRRAMASGVGVLDLALLHWTAILESLPASAVPDPTRTVIHRGGRYLAEALAAYEMALRGFREANTKLHQIASQLERRVDERTRELQGSEERYRRLFHASPLPMWVFDEETLAFLAVNESAVRHYGYTADEFAGMTIRDIRPEQELPALADALKEARERFELGTWRHRKKDGTVISVEVRAHPITFSGRRARLVLVNDITERRQLEDQLRQAQKMEAIGRLAGGIAHDFNNLLSVVLTYSNLLAQGLASDDRMRADLAEIERAGQRAAALTRQLLAFSRQQVLEPRIVDLNEVVLNMDRMLRRLIGEDIELVTRPGSGLRPVRVDPGQIEQVLMNLVVNARDAMPQGGKLTIETANVDLDSAYARDHVGARPGPHILLAVSDTGTGMDKATLARVFEPFFTTKEKGKGTGLGLSTAFGIVSQSGGSIGVASEPGKGTAFRVYLPESRDARGGESPAKTAQPMTLAGNETILLVEDEEQVRTLVRTILGDRGYAVLESQDGDEALRIGAEHSGPIHLLLTDVVLPGMSGRILAEKLAARRVGVKVLYMSGYTDDAAETSRILAPGVHFLQKPITPEALTRKVREVLDAQS